MKRIITLLLITGASMTAGYAQTNTFPSSGNVGMGTTSPAEKLHVKGDVRFERGGTGGSNYLHFYSDAGGNFITSDDPITNHKNLYFRVVSPNSESGARHMYFQTAIKDGASTTRMAIMHNGNVGIGTTNPQAKLAVNGIILASEVKVKADITVPDYVFEPDYNLLTLEEVENYVREHKHLPEIPAAADIQRDGLDLAAMNLQLLKKVEELTLHLIENEKEKKQMAADIALLKAKVEALGVNN